MALNISVRRSYNIIKQSPLYIASRFSSCHYSSDSNKSGDEKRSPGGFAQAFERYTRVVDETEVPKEESFATLFRKSKFIDLGDPSGKVVIGKIFHIVGDDLYIDFDWKFYCVCPRPQKNGSDYARGAKVRLSIKDLELSTKFLGSDKDLTILEADAILLGLASSPLRSRPDVSTAS